MNGAQFKQYRVRLGLSQRQAADLLGYSSKTAVSNLEAKTNPPSLLACTLLRVLDGLNEQRSRELMEQLLEKAKIERMSRKRASK